MQDLRKIAETRAAQGKNKPVGASFETEHQRAKKALVKQIEELDGSNVLMIAANSEDENGEKKILRVAAYCRVSTDDIDQAVSLAHDPATRVGQFSSLIPGQKSASSSSHGRSSF